jgi:hypothetical protein
MNSLLFTQGSSVLPFLTSLGLHQGPLYTNEYEEVYYRNWRSSIINPMNANILFVAYKCNNSFKMKIFHNEKPLRFENASCDSNNVCDINEFINNLAVDTDSCDFTKLCSGTVTDDDLVTQI